MNITNFYTQIHEAKNTFQKNKGIAPDRIKIHPDLKETLIKNHKQNFGLDLANNKEHFIFEMKIISEPLMPRYTFIIYLQSEIKNNQ